MPYVLLLVVMPTVSELRDIVYGKKFLDKLLIFSTLSRNFRLLGIIYFHAEKVKQSFPWLFKKDKEC